MEKSMNSNVAAATNAQAPSSIFVVPPTMWITFLIACVALAVAFEPSLRGLIDVWFQSEEFSYGPILPFVCGFLIWQQRDVIERSTFEGSWAGVVLLIAAATLALVGQIATVPVFSHLGIVAALGGLTLATCGWAVFRKLIGAFAVLSMAVPLPAFLMNDLSLELQLLSSRIGVAIVRLFGISVFLEGNVIDLGAYKLEVAEACSGLRYLFPLMTLGFLMAYIFKVKMWKRAVLFLSSIPIAILMNSARIGAIGVMVDRWGTAMAEGFLHEFQGWAVFMVSAAVMLGEMIALSRIGKDRRPWREVFGLEFPPPRARTASRVQRSMHSPLLAAAAFAVAIAGASLLMPTRVEATPNRSPLIMFPARLGNWVGQRSVIEPVYLDALKLDDYMMADYRSAVLRPVNFYIAWYDSQRSGKSAHSPRSCLPGGGWEIQSLTQIDVPTALLNGKPLRVNRALIALGQQRQITYYWFQQRGRNVTNEYLVKWYLFWDALTRNRSDGALVRLIVPLTVEGAEADADKTLVQFLAIAAPELPRFVPN
jgi:exosortase D (VPLPA-CTERM-specific)